MNQQTKTIGDYTYSCHTVDAIRGLQLHEELSFLLPVLPRLAPLVGQKDLDMGSIAEAISDLKKSLQPGDWPRAVTSLVKLCRFKKGDGEFSTLEEDAAIALHFGSDIGRLYQVAMFSMRVQFGDFFADAQRRLQQLRATKD